jgi:hypothetical protein
MSPDQPGNKCPAGSRILPSQARSACCWLCSPLCARAGTAGRRPGAAVGVDPGRRRTRGPDARRWPALHSRGPFLPSSLAGPVPSVFGYHEACCGGRSLSPHAACRAVPDGRAVGAPPAQGTRFHRRTAGGLLAVPGHQFRAQPQGMPIIESATAAGFARRQVVTARNIRGGRFTTFMLGGLNYQIGHHLCPSMPRPNLRRVEGLVRDFLRSGRSRLQRRKLRRVIPPDHPSP